MQASIEEKPPYAELDPTHLWEHESIRETLHQAYNNNELHPAMVTSPTIQHTQYLPESHKEPDI
jgi:hypothetical protein